MKSIDKIINCDKCKEYSIRLTGSHYNDIVSDAYYKIIKAENNGNIIKNHISYYKRTLWIQLIEHSKQSKTICVNEDLEVKEDIDTLQEEKQKESIALKNYLSLEPKSKKDKFLQDLIILSLHLNKTDICKRLDWDRGELRKYLKQAYKKIQDEYIRINNSIN